MLRRQLGAELRRIRETARRTVADVAGELGWSESKLSRIETANSGIRTSDLERLLGVYGVDGGEAERLTALAGQSRQRAWWEVYGDALPNAYETYIGLEAEATSIFTYQAQMVPGLLQTAEYASAIMQAHLVEAVAEQRVAVRMARQAVLARTPQPELVAVLDEAVLRRPIGGTDIMRRQLLRLIEASERPLTTIQVLPFSAGAHQALDGSFVLLEFTGGSDQPLVYSEGKTGGLFHSKPEEFNSYRQSFESLRVASLDPVESVSLIEAVARGEK